MVTVRLWNTESWRVLHWSWLGPFSVEQTAPVLVPMFNYILTHRCWGASGLYCILRHMCKLLLRTIRADLVCLIAEIGSKHKANHLHHIDRGVCIYLNHIDSTPCTQRGKTKYKFQNPANEELEKNHSKFCSKARIGSIHVLKKSDKQKQSSGKH